MRKLILLFAAAAAFTITIMARADMTVPLPTKSIHYSPETMVLTVTGNLPNQCAASPRPILNASEHPNILVLNFVATQVEEQCITLLGGAYDLAFDIRSLKSHLVEIGANPESTYKIISRDGSFTEVVDFSKVLTTSYSTQEIIGGVFVNQATGQYIVSVSPTEFFELNSPFINVEKYIGKKVELQGHLLKIRTPEVGARKMIPPQPSFLVTGINTTAY